MRDAVSALSSTAEAASILAGGTWVMRGPIRGEAPRSRYISISKIPELQILKLKDNELRIGAAVTHARCFEALRTIADYKGIATAAVSAANLSIREMATLGGNLSAWQFAASDFTPALLCLDATVDIQSESGSERIGLAEFIERRPSLSRYLLLNVNVPRRSWRTTHVRLPLRVAGDYPVAIVSMAVSLSADQKVDDCRIAVGSVEQSARRWFSLEELLIGKALNAQSAYEMAKLCRSQFVGRDSVEVPQWYRVEVLPALVRRAVSNLLA